MARSETTFTPASAPARGRPAGARNIIDRQVKALAGVHTPDAIKKLAQIMNSETVLATNPMAVIAAVNSLLDRAVGKPRQAVELSGDSDNPISVSMTDARDRLKLVIDSVAATLTSNEDTQQPIE